MTLAERLLEDGRRLFRSRSVMPLMLLPLLVLALPESARVEAALGESRSRIVEWLAFAVALSGLALRCATQAFAPEGTSSRDTRAVRAPSLNTTGVYSLVRHPLYLGAGLMWVGAAMSLRVWWFTLIVALVYWLYVERLMLVEEGFLEEQFGEQFRRWAGQTPTVLPSLSGWRPATGSIQWRRVLGEHNGFLGLAFALLFLQVLEDLPFGGQSLAQWYRDHSDLVALLVFAVAVSAVCIVIRRRTEGPKAIISAALVIMCAAVANAAGPQTATQAEPKARPDLVRYPYSEGDVDFMTGMIPHHAQAVLIAGWAESHGANPGLRVLCERMVVGQRDEITFMRNWLRDRGETVPDANATHHRMKMNGVEHDMLMPGMLTPEQLAELDKARGPQWDRLFLTFMIGHHEGALTMVDELFNAFGALQDDDVYKLASDIHADQTIEIERMRKMLSR